MDTGTYYTARTAYTVISNIM